MEFSDIIDINALKVFTAKQAWEYKLVPYKRCEISLYCIGSKNMHYENVTQEIEMLYSCKLQVEIVDHTKVINLLKKYYAQPVQAKIELGRDFLLSMVNDANENNSSDIHFEISETKGRIRFRIDGQMIEKYVVDRQQYSALINQIKIMSNMDISEKRLPQDGRISYKGAKSSFDIRVSSLPTIYGEKIVLRLLTRQRSLLELNNLGFSPKQYEDYMNAIRNPNGLILISGPTGSGKSTTLYATLRELNKETSNILTIEDPVEYILNGVNQVQLKEEIGLTFPNALRTFLRQDPDIIMLGEIRDSETAQMAIRSSLTGHLIFSTLHTNSAYGAVARLADMGIHPYLISCTLILSVSQRLVRLICSKCNAIGCESCHFTGYRGRKAIYEVIPVDKDIKEAMLNPSESIDNMLSIKGITKLNDAAMKLFQRGETTYQEILPIIQKKND